MRNPRWLLCIAACVLAVAAPIASAAPDSHRPLTDLGRASDIASPIQPGPTREGVLVNLTRWAIDNGALAQTFDPDTGINWILLPKGSALDIDDIPDTARGATEVRITNARFAKETYDAAEAAVMELATSGRTSHSVGLRIDAEKGVLSVETLAPAEVTAPLSERFGEAIEFVRTDGGRLLSGGRTVDASPHWGGAQLRIGSEPWCSSGPSVRSGAITYGTTAGHCGENGTIWNSGGNPFGYTNLEGWPPPNDTGIDTARITAGAVGGVYGPRIYWGHPTTGSSLIQVGADDPAGAITVWTSGARTGSTSGVVTDLNKSVCYPENRCVVGLFSTDNTSVDQGDSGGVVHTVSGSNAGVRGTVSGRSAVREFVTKWSWIAWYLGVTIMTP